MVLTLNTLISLLTAVLFWVFKVEIDIYSSMMFQLTLVCILQWHYILCIIEEMALILQIKVFRVKPRKENQEHMPLKQNAHNDIRNNSQAPDQETQMSNNKDLKYGSIQGKDTSPKH